MEHSYIVSIIDYNPATGDTNWKNSLLRSSMWNTKYAGKRVGCIITSQSGMQYWKTKIDGIPFLVHRVIWFYVTGEWPEDQIDHWNGNGLDNKWDNLRDASQAQNLANAKNLMRGIDPFPNGKWRAKITIDHKQIHLGMFDSKEEAFEVYKQALIDTHGEFAIYNRS